MPTYVYRGPVQILRQEGGHAWDGIVIRGESGQGPLDLATRIKEEVVETDPFQWDIVTCSEVVISVYSEKPWAVDVDAWEERADSEEDYA